VPCAGHGTPDGGDGSADELREREAALEPRAADVLFDLDVIRIGILEVHGISLWKLRGQNIVAMLHRNNAWLLRRRRKEFSS
jgi:hypothetical protein